MGAGGSSPSGNPALLWTSSDQRQECRKKRCPRPWQRFLVLAKDRGAGAPQPLSLPLGREHSFLREVGL